MAKEEIPTQNQSPFLSTEEAADFLKTTVKTIYRLVHDRRIPHYKRGTRLIFKRSELIEWVEKDRVAME